MHSYKKKKIELNQFTPLEKKQQIGESVKGYYNFFVDTPFFTLHTDIRAYPKHSCLEKFVQTYTGGVKM